MILFEEIYANANELTLEELEKSINELFNQFTLIALTHKNTAEKNEMLKTVFYYQTFFKMIKRMKIKWINKRSHNSRSLKKKTGVSKLKGGYKIIEKNGKQYIANDTYREKNGEIVIIYEEGADVPNKYLELDHLSDIDDILSMQSIGDDIGSGYELAAHISQIGNTELEWAFTEANIELEGVLKTLTESSIQGIARSKSTDSDISDLGITQMTDDMEALNQKRLRKIAKRIATRKIVPFIDRNIKRMKELRQDARLKWDKTRMSLQEAFEMHMNILMQRQIDKDAAIRKKYKDRHLEYIAELRQKQKTSFMSHIGIGLSSCCYGLVSGGLYAASEPYHEPSPSRLEIEGEDVFRKEFTELKMALLPELSERDRIAKLVKFQKEMKSEVGFDKMFKFISNITTKTLVLGKRAQVKSRPLLSKEDWGGSCNADSNCVDRLDELLNLPVHDLKEFTSDLYAEALSEAVIERIQLTTLRGVRAVSVGDTSLQSAAANIAEEGIFSGKQLGINYSELHEKLRGEFKKLITELQITSQNLMKHPLVLKFIENWLGQLSDPELTTQQFEFTTCLGNTRTCLSDRVTDLITPYTPSFNYAVGTCCCSLICTYFAKSQNSRELQSMINQEIELEAEISRGSQERYREQMMVLESTREERYYRPVRRECISAGSILVSAGAMSAGLSHLASTGVELSITGGIPSWAIAYLCGIGLTSFKIYHSIADERTKHHNSTKSTYKKSKGGKTRKLITPMKN